VRSAWLERLAIAVASLALAVVLILLVSGYFSGRDIAPVSGDAAIGLSFPDEGDQLLAPGQLHPPYDSEPPTSGPHIPAPIRRDESELSDNQLLQALSVGDVVLMYGSRRPPAGLARLATRLAGRFTRSLAASGLAVLLARRPGISGVTALAWTRMLRLGGVDAPLLREFTDAWLGRGA
jgi:hypothetical protein